MKVSFSIPYLKLITLIDDNYSYFIFNLLGQTDMAVSDECRVKYKSLVKSFQSQIFLEKNHNW